MSNENSSINRPRHYYKVGGNKSVSRARKFSCITYLSELQLKVCLCAHSNQIRCFAYAFHDKDTKEDGSLKEPHFHLIIVTYSAHSVSAIRRWFGGYHDSNGEITTTGQVCTDVYEMYDYLTHNTKQCREQGKYLYDKSIIVSNDTEGFFKASEESSFDTITLALESLLNGCDIHTLAKRYGRDFILHYNSLKQVVCDITRCKKHNMNLEDILEHEYQIEINELNK